ncbi:BglG family transcription antiterminator [Gracilibacillus alcaliphilus]|uniref:BglG family transcription antiterminator n=1 Tax=Gracilibacillus alcaliphilus TaxID=1401441 RepID=UPI001959418F|nr:PTS sugar transporter subunit IIA [Gracilibacillus alcaliphilus]MBM7676051.1 lichenan operon transcriptional antiterminator [Gracilibacillus alcaliphilus]
MKEKNIQALIHLLQEQQEWMKSQQILDYLQISSRTLRNYIKYINEHYQDSFFIESSSAGYRLKVINTNGTAPAKEKDSSNRMYYILQQLILAEDGVNIFDLSDHLFVSVPTIEKDLIECRKFIKLYDLTIQRSKDLLFLQGKEINKRKIMSAIYYREYNTTFYNIIDLENIFGYELHEFKNQLLHIIHSHGYDINEYTLGNIIYHIIISIERIQDHQYIHSHTYPFKEEFISIDALDEIKQLIESYFQVNIDENELYYLQALISSKTTYIKKANYVQTDYLDLINDIIRNVNESYLIHLDDEEFKTKFALHVQNMVIRAANDFSFKNPLTQSIKTSSPLIYDLSVYISNLISEKLNIRVQEDEIAYIALHVGSCLELKQKTSDQLEAVLICPAYNHLPFQIKEKIEQYFTSQLVIIRVITRLDKELAELEADLIMTTIDLPVHANSEPVVISSFITMDDIFKIQQQMNKIKHIKQQQWMKQSLLSLFDKRMFMVTDRTFTDEFDVIHFITKQMEALNLVQVDFVENVIKREKLSSTAFNNIVAVPHSIKMDALQTSIAVLITDKPIKWGEATNIRIVSLIAMNKNERNIYRDIYDEYIKILASPANVSKLASSTTYETFIDQLITFIEQQAES